MKTAMIVILALSSSTLAVASSGQEQQQQPTQKVISFSQIQEACLTPSKFQNQVAPSNITISCKDQQTKWVPMESGSIGMNNQRQVSIAVASDKYTVGTESQSLEAVHQVTACPKFKQTLETLEVSRTVSCEELGAYQGSGIDFCDQTAKSLKLDNPAAATVEETGRVIELCTVATPGEQNSGDQGSQGNAKKKSNRMR